MYKLFVLISMLIFCQNSQAFDKKAKQLLEKYCFDCHSDGVDKGEFEFDKIMSESLTTKENQKVWHKIWDVIAEEQMPPADKKKQPSAKEREELLIALETAIFSVDRKKQYASPIGLVRLSNQQYGNAIKDLTGTYRNPSSQLPLDPTSSGFNNITSTLNISPLLFERYEKIAYQMSRGMFHDHTMDRGLANKGKMYLKKTGDGSDLQKVQDKVAYFAKMAFRRPPSKDEVNDLMTVYKKDKSRNGHKHALMETFRSIMVSPSFIFRTELLGVDGNKDGLARLDEFALASRLSFFLWNTGPDDRLLKLAEKGKLRAELDKTVASMMKSGRFKASIESFGQHWLGIQYLQNNVPSRKVFRKFEREYLTSMKRETTHFLTDLFKNDRPINEIFSSQETFIDSKLAKLYGVKAPKKGFEKIKMPDSHNRRGILSQPSVLIVTSDPDRTSPVKRGLWILENVLGMPPPPAPAGVEGINENDKSMKKLTFRQKLEKHRSNKACASCHAMMDPLGFTMESFSAIGKWRTEDHGKPLDTKSVWRGDKINNFDDLYKLITTKYRHKFLACFTKKLMTYALGRGMEIEDHIAINRIASNLSKPDSTFHQLFLELIKSTPFQYRSLEKEHAAK